MNNKDFKPTMAQLRTFITIAEHKHFGTAASKLGISQPSLSQALAALEEGLGVQLIERSTRKVIVTPVGERLLPFALQAIDSVDALISNARGANGILSGSLNLGIIPTIAPYLLPNLLATVKDKYPECTPRITEDQTQHLLDQLRDGQIDAAIMATPKDNAHSLSAIKLYEEPFVLVVPADNPHAGHGNIQLTDLADCKLLLLDDGHCLRDQVVDLCRQADLSLNDYADFTTKANSLITIIQCVSAGMGSTVIPVTAVPIETNRPDVALARFAPTVTASREVSLVFRSTSTRHLDFLEIARFTQQAYHEAAMQSGMDIPAPAVADLNVTQLT